MMRISSRTALGLALEPGRMVLAQVRLGARPVVTRVAQLTLEQGLDQAEPAALGAQLQQLLRQRRITAKRVVIGLPALWVMHRQVHVPPAPSAALAGVLRLQAERVLAADPRELAMDFIPPAAAAADAPQPVLLIGAAKRRVERAVAVARAAGLTVDAVTVSILALAQSLARSQDAELIAHVRDHAMEWAVQQGGTLRLMRHTTMPDADESASPVDVAAALRQAMTAEPLAAEAYRVERLRLVDAHGLSEPQLVSLARAVGLDAAQRVDLAELAHLPAEVPDGQTPAQQFAPAIALARGADRRHRPVVDLLHSRLTSPPRRYLGPRQRAAALVALLLAAGLGWLVMTVRSEAQEVESLRQQLQELEPTLKDAQRTLEQVRFAQRWFQARPALMDCLRQLCLAFPDEGIQATELTWQDSGQAVLTGRGADTRIVLELRDRLQHSDAFGQVKLNYLREAGGRDAALSSRAGSSTQIGFSLSFGYASGGSAGRSTGEPLTSSAGAGGPR